jgi:succinate dehydrogenase / fumarate reductase, cytochrome b subunit
MTTHERPLSPHIQIYRPQLTSVLSILHRLAGIALAVGTLLLVYWLFAAAAGEAEYERAQAVIGSWFGRLLLFGWSFVFFFHFLNGIRHLCWDAGWGFELRTAYATGWAVVFGAIVLTVVAWVCGYVVMGAL